MGGSLPPLPRAPGRVPERGEVAQNRSWPGLISPSRSAHEAGAVAAAYLDSQDRVRVSEKLSESHDHPVGVQLISWYPEAWGRK